MSVTVSQALHDFLNARKTAANADLIERWSIDMECQVNVMAADGEPVAGKKSTWTNGSDTWHSIRIPKNAAADPTWEDYKIGYPFDLYAEGIGMTGWDWQARCSRHFGYDFDALTGHAQGIGIEEKALEKVKEAACALPYVEVRRSTGGGGIHLYVYLDDAGVPTENHTEHAALARCILGMMSAEVGFDFASAIDAAGHVMWVWHRKMSAENHGLEIIKPVEKRLGIADLPANWRDHIEVVKGRRSKIRVNEIAEDDQDPFEVLASSRKIVPLDDSHKAQVQSLMQSGFTTLWVQDHHLLQTHTRALRSLMEEGELSLVGVFKTISDGRDPATPNCFCFPLPNGAWKVYRFSPGVQETDTWSQDGEGWTWCYFNRRPDLAMACKLIHGVEDPDKKIYVFNNTHEPGTVVEEFFGQKIDFPEPAARQVRLRPHKDGRLVVEYDKLSKTEEAREGWIDKGNRCVRIFNVQIDEPEETVFDEYEGIIRALRTAAGDRAGWVAKDGKVWVHQPAGEVKMILQSLGNAKSQAEEIMGAAAARSWKLVNLPFREEYPGGRQWNIDAAQFKYRPAELADDEVPYHPHWDMIFDHIGTELTPVLKDLPWAVNAGIKTGADYLRAWVACAFREPFEPTSYLFLFGSENCGKSTLYESLKRLVTKGVVKADGALKDGATHNGELGGAIICAVEEVDLQHERGALAKIKDWVVSPTIPIRKMRSERYEEPNATHWIQTANKQSACPVFPGDTRITMIYVPDLLEEQKIGKKKLMPILEEEASDFMYTLMHLELPPIVDRLRLPVVETASKVQSQSKHDYVAEFLAERCEWRAEARTAKDAVHATFREWCINHDRTPLNKIAFGKHLGAIAKAQKIELGDCKVMVDGKEVHGYAWLALKP